MTITISGGGLNFSGGGISIESGTPAVTGIVPVADAAYLVQGWATGTDYTTITNGGTGAWNMVYGGIQGGSDGARTIALSEGNSFYFEVEYIGGGLPYTLYGMCRSSSPGGYANVPSIYLANGDGYGGMTGGASLGGFAPGDIMRVAYDATANTFWLGRNSNWYLDPVSSAGTAIPGTGSLQFILMSASSGGCSLNGMFRKLSQNTYSTPTGFNACTL